MASECALALLITIFESSFVDIPVEPSTDALTRGVPVAKLTGEGLPLAHSELTLTLHLAVIPSASIDLVLILLNFVVSPSFSALTVWH